MIETTNSEIDVNELMKRVRREARRVVPLPPDAPNPRRPGTHGVGSHETPRDAPPLESQIERMGVLLGRAYEKNQVNAWIPSIFRSFFRRQGGFNRAALEILADLVKANEQLRQRVAELSAVATAQSQWLRGLARERQIETAEKQAARDQVTELE